MSSVKYAQRMLKKILTLLKNVFEKYVYNFDQFDKLLCKQREVLYIRSVAFTDRSNLDFGVWEHESQLCDKDDLQDGMTSKSNICFQKMKMISLCSLN